MFYLNAKVADALRTIQPDEKGFVVIARDHVNLTVFIRRFGTIPDNEAQVYALNEYALEQMALRGKQMRVLGSFEYTLCVSPMSPRRIWALMLSSSVSFEADLLISIHAPERAAETNGKMVIHFVDEAAMRRFAAAI